MFRVPEPQLLPYLKPWVDGEAAGSRIHTGNVLHVCDLLQRQLVPVIPGTENIGEGCVRVWAGECRVKVRHDVP